MIEEKNQEYKKAEETDGNDYGFGTKGREKEILHKLLEAKRLEGEALLLLLPESARGHLRQIGRECEAMAEELIFDLLAKQKCRKEPEQKKQIKKVIISD